MCEGRYYKKDSIISVEENAKNEFTGSELAVKELPPWCYFWGTYQRTRRAASRAINRFLNSNRGGIVHLGVSDESCIIGLRLSQYQKDHVMASMIDLMSRYKPSEDPRRY